MKRVIGITSLLGLLLAAPALARFMSPKDIPVERLVANLARQVQERPKDARAHYVLGRVHALAFTMRTSQLVGWPAHEENEPPRLPATWIEAKLLGKEGQPPRWLPPDRQELPPPRAEALLEHLAQGVRSLRRAVELDASVAEHHLTLGYLLEEGAHLASMVNTPELLADRETLPSGEETEEIERLVNGLGAEDPAGRDAVEAQLVRRLPSALAILHARRADPDERIQSRVARLLSSSWRARAAEAYGRALDLAFERELKEGLPLSLLGPDVRDLVSHEAAHGFLRLARREEVPLERRDERVQETRAALERVSAVDFARAITPIVLSLESASSLDELLAPGARVEFDLDGDLVAEEWPWLRPQAAFLVWDPQREGRITSGRQLFGSATWWLLFEDGYRALAALDDNGDGWLAGAELDGLALWWDRDGDGVSDAGEVVPIECTSVRALATRATSLDGLSPCTPRGLVLDDGRALPSWDWIVEPCPPRG